MQSKEVTQRLKLEFQPDKSEGSAARAPRKEEMKSKLVLLIVFAVALAACSSPAAPTATTAPVAPTEAPTAAPTEAPPPTEAPTNTPEPTADLAATEAAQAAEQAAELAASAGEAITAELAEAGYTAGQGLVSWVLEPIEIVINEQTFDGVWDDLGSDAVYEDFALSVDVTWETKTGLSGCGFLFRAEDDLDRGAQIEFYTGRLSGAPFWGIEFYRFGDYQSSLGSGYSSAIKDGQGSTNHYLLVVQGLEVRIFANGTRVGYASLPAARTDGRIAFLAWQDSGLTTCTFENALIWEFVEN